MDIRNKRLKGYFILSVLIIACLIMASAMTFFAPNKKAEAINAMSNNIEIGNLLVNGYATKDKIFDGKQLSSLYEYLTGQKNANFDDVKAAGKKDSNFFRNTALNSANKDLIVTICDLNWSVVYLSNTKEDGTGDVILTLWLSDTDQLPSNKRTSKWSNYYSSNSTTQPKYPSNMYGTSYIRAVTLNNGGYYATSSTGLSSEQTSKTDHQFAQLTTNVTGNITKFITVPSQVEWQRKETSTYKTGGSNGNEWNFNNDSLENVADSSFNHTNDSDLYKYNYQVTPSESTISQVQRTADYTAWKYDKIWLPSMAEAGWALEGSKGIWNTSENIRQNFNESTNTWLRSANPADFNTAYSLYSNKSDSPVVRVEQSASVRPAFHLNLTEAEKNSVLDKPTDVSVNYNGEEWTSLENVSAEQKTWYNGSIALTFPVGMKDAKTYQVTATITTGGVFAGEATKTGESEKVRIFNFTIKPKEIGVVIAEDNKTVTPKSGAICSKDVGTDRAPTFGVTYSGRDGTVYNTPEVYPMGVAGKYRATAKILTNGINYVLDDTYTKDFQIDKREIDKPYLSYDTSTYNGSSQEFEVSGISGDITITPQTSGLTYKDGKLSAKDFIEGGYLAYATLNDTDNTQWKGGGSDPIELPITINKATLNITEFKSDGGWSWNSGIDKAVSITDNRQGDNEKLTFSVSYNGNSIDASKVVQDSINKKQTNITIPRLSTAGSYTLNITLDNSGDGKNYNPLTAEQPFTITDKVITVAENNISWSYSNNGNETALSSWNSTDLVCEVTYNGYDYTFTATVSGITDGTVIVDRYDTRSGKDVDVYTTTAYLSSTDGNVSPSSFSINWKINQGKYNLSGVKWNYVEGSLRYNGNSYTVKLDETTLPEGLSVDSLDYSDNRAKDVKEEGYKASIVKFTNSNLNYITPIRPINGEPMTYDYNGGEFPWDLNWKILKGRLVLQWNDVLTKSDSESGATFNIPQVSGDEKEYIDSNSYKYYKDNRGAKGEEITVDEIVLGDGATFYWVEAVLTSNAGRNYEIEDVTKSKRFVLGSDAEEVCVELSKSKFTYDGNAHGNSELRVRDSNFMLNKLTITYYKDSVSEENELTGAPSDAGDYIIVLAMSESDLEDYYLTNEQIRFSIAQKQLAATWDTSGITPTLSGLNASDTLAVEYIYTDEQGDEVALSQLEGGKTYKVKAHIKSGYEGNYVFVNEYGIVLAEPTTTSEQTFELKADEPILEDPTELITPVDPENPSEPQPPATTFDFSKILDAIKQNWQPIVSLVSIILTLIFMSKGMGYASKRKKVKKTIEKRYSNAFYAISGIGLFGLPNTTWTIVACIMAGVTLLAFIFMLLQKKSYNKALEEMEDAKDEYNRTMFMHGNNANGGINGGMGMGQQGVVYAQQPQFAIEDMRSMINDAMSNMLPTVTQYLPQEASYNDELVQQLIDQNAQNEERMRQMNEENEERVRQLAEQNEAIIRNLAQGQEMLMQKIAQEQKESVDEDVIERLVEKLAKQQALEREAEKQAEKEVAAANANAEVIKSLIEGQKAIMEKLSKQEDDKHSRSDADRNAEKIEMLMRNQERLMEKVIELSAKNSSDKPSERLMEKMIELTAKSAEKSVEKYVPIPVEKVVEKEVKVEVPVEKIVEVEKVVPMPVEKPAKEVAPRLTLDEAYAKLSSAQKKIFDTLKNYAMSKDKCKENKSTYFTVLGQSSVNPLVKLTIKKNTTVALFKMEDEYMKDIRRGASSDGTKVKVKETEVVVGDNQALATAKNMIDLREDQIERYNDYLKEQKSLRNK